MKEQNRDRRNFLKSLGFGVLALPFVNQLLTASGEFVAYGLTKLNVKKNPTAKALNYVHNAKKVDTKKFPQKNDKTMCSTCNLYKANAENKGWGTCTLFPGNLVREKGWCSSWIPKA